ncbi:hypothetical protein XH96_33290 [Bradyrhizobium sp. CCBAU 51765]|nr:hypothetical protein XH96_33290 [Bradyrhizobium sp. CCBAU 51765]
MVRSPLASSSSALFDAIWRYFTYSGSTSSSSIDHEFGRSSRQQAVSKDLSILTGVMIFHVNSPITTQISGLSWPRLSEQQFRVDKWSFCQS